MMSDVLTPNEETIAAVEQAVPAPTSRLVLEETLDAAINGGQITESGRTWCSSDARGELRGPVERLPAAIELEGCPPGDLVVTWHTHTSREQLFNPEHSLPDIANLAFGNVDVSIVPGIESDHVIIAPDNRAAMADAFRNATGLDVSSPQDVTAAINDGTISAAASLRDRTFDQFGGLVQRVDADRSDLAPIARDVFDLSTAPSHGDVCAGLHTVECDPETPGGDTVATARPRQELRAAGVMRRESRSITHHAESITERFNIAETVVGTTVGMFTSRLLERAVFGD